MSKYRNINESDIERLSRIIVETDSETKELDEIFKWYKSRGLSPRCKRVI
jgi:hypothetical protein